MNGNACSRQILIIGQKNIQNALFAKFLSTTLGYACHIEEIPKDGKLNLGAGESLILIDHVHQSQSGSGNYLARLGEASEELNIAFINMPKDAEQDHLLEWSQVKGIFYDDANQDQLLKGVQEIFDGQCWFSRQLVTRYLHRHRITQFEPCHTMSVLTVKEQQIIWCMAKGDSNKKIAHRLSISDRTVKTHVYNIFRKIDVTNRVQAANWVKNCREQFVGDDPGYSRIGLIDNVGSK